MAGREGTTDPATATFVAHRNLLFTIAYEMLGSAADAEDVLQETWLRWVKVDLGRVRDQRAYLTGLCFVRNPARLTHRRPVSHATRSSCQRSGVRLAQLTREEANRQEQHVKHRIAVFGGTFVAHRVPAVATGNQAAGHR